MEDGRLREMMRFGAAMRRGRAKEGAAEGTPSRVGSSRCAVAALYLGLFSMLPFVGPFAVLFGLLAMRDLRRRPELRGAWRAKLGLAAGAAGTIVWAMLWLHSRLG
jgi:hypothetical protein